MVVASQTPALGYGKELVSSLFAGSIRLPLLMLNLNGVMLTAELVKRGFDELIPENGITKKLSNMFSWIPNDLARPYTSNNKDSHGVPHFTTQRVAVLAITCLAVSNVGLEVVRYVLGNPPPIYNRVLQWISPILVSGLAHPLVRGLY